MHLRTRLLIFGITSIILATWAMHIYGNSSDSSLISRLQSCSKPSDSGRETCLRAVIGDTLQRHDGQEIMRELNTLPKPQCHVPSHILGQELMKKYRSVEDALVHCTQECSAGCTHGIIGQAFLETPGIKVSLEDLSHPSEKLILEHGKEFCAISRSACHGVGHILLQIYGDFDKAMDRCNTIATNAAEKLKCGQGVFMENSFSVPTEIALDVENTRRHNPDDLLFPCNVVKPEHGIYCYHFLGQEQDLTFDQKGISDQNKRNSLRLTTCERLSDKRQYRACIEGAAFASRGTLNCRQFTDEADRAMCINGIATSYATFDLYDAVLSYCAQQHTSLEKKSCYEAYFSSINIREVFPLSNACKNNQDEDCPLYLNAFKITLTNQVYAQYTQ
jgi:hypothetical protein